MGHMRIAGLPDTKPWGHVVGLLADKASAAQVVVATATASVRGLNLAANDEGVAHSFWLLNQVPKAAEQPSFVDGLREAGVSVEADPGLFDLASGFSAAVDHYLDQGARRTDLGEIAQLAAVTSLTELLGHDAPLPHAADAHQLQQLARQFGGQGGFATLAQDFFTQFSKRFLLYHLGRELSQHFCPNGRFHSVDEHHQFLDQLDAHCRQATSFVHDFATDWFRTHDVKEGLTPQKSRHFTHRSLKLLTEELKQHGGHDG